MSQERQTAEGDFIRNVRVQARQVSLGGTLGIPPRARGIVLFAHGSGSSRFSPRNRFVAGVLHAGSLATLLIDLLTPEEEAIDVYTAKLRFDIGLLAQRLDGATDWLGQQPETRDLPLGYFGASTGGGAALVAAAQRPELVKAVVSRGGRPDLAGPALPRVQAPTLLIVGGLDYEVIQLNRQAMAQMRAPVELRIVPGATHLFEEPGALEQVADLSRDWFVRYLEPAPPSATEEAHPET
ncbi:MAG TPA: dienelactone hydrolase family protein [Thermomicrobiaceae bacterium]|nr:dienelactone hydrolase family protein [Thermomicrobiaceae bacterium]